MTKQVINVGTTANDKKGDSLRAAFQKVNTNFTELYTALGLDDTTLNLGAFDFTGSTISTTDSSSITIDQATTISSNLTVGGDILPQTDLGGNLGSPSQRWKTLYLSSSTVYFNNIPMSVDSNGTLKINGTTISGSGSVNYNDLSNKPTIPTDVSDLTDTTNLLSGTGTDPVFDTVTAVNGFYGEHTPQVGYRFTTGFLAATGDINTTTTYWTLWMDSSYDALVAAGDKTGWTLRSNLVDTNTVTITSYNYSVVGGFKRIDITTSANLTYTFDATQMIWTSPDYTAAVNGPVTLHAGSKEWTFATNGITTFPNNLTIESDGAHNLIAQGGGGNLYLDAASDVVVRGVSNVYIRSDNENFEWGFTDGGIISLPGSTASIYGFTDTLELFADSNSNNGIGISSSQTNVINSGAVRIVSDTDGNEHTWTFGADGTLTLPGTGTIRTAYGAMSINAPSGSSNLSIKSNDATTYMIVGNGSAGVTAGAYNWQFSNTGNLTFPDSTVQTTAFTGIAQNISSENDVNITVNLSDSTKRIWSFDEGGDLHIPGNIIVPGTGSVIATVDNNLRVGTSAFGNFISTTAPNSGSAGYVFANYMSGSGGTNYPDLANVQVGWQISGPGINSGATVSGVNTVDFGSGQLIRQILVPSNGSSGSFTGFDEYTFTDPVNREVTNNYWQFGTNGDLTFPDGAKYAGKTVTMPTTTTGVTNSFVWEFSDNVIGSDKITLNWNLLASDTGSFYIGTTHSTDGKYLIIDGNDQSLSYIASGTPTDGKLVFGESTNGGAGGVNDIELHSTNGDVRIATDNNSNRWTFGDSGNFSFPDASVQTTAYPGTLAAAKFPYYADTSARDTAIPSPVNGMVCIVAGSLYFYGNAQWLQLAGTP